MHNDPGTCLGKVGKSEDIFLNVNVIKNNKKVTGYIRPLMSDNVKIEHFQTCFLSNNRNQFNQFY